MSSCSQAFGRHLVIPYSQILSSFMRIKISMVRLHGLYTEITNKNLRNCFSEERKKQILKGNFGLQKTDHSKFKSVKAR